MKSCRNPGFYPLFCAFGHGLKPMPPEDARTASFEDRVAAIWYYLTSLVVKFHRAMNGSERANMDPEDILMEVYAKLKAVDPRWNPDRADYKPFAVRCTKSFLVDLRERCRTVKTPKSGGSRAAEYQCLIDAGTAGPVEVRRVRELARTMRECGTTEDMEGLADRTVAADREALALERRNLAADAIAVASASLTYRQCQILGEACGYGQHEPSKVCDIARRYGVRRCDIEATILESIAIMRMRLIECNHPFLQYLARDETPTVVGGRSRAT